MPPQKISAKDKGKSRTAFRKRNKNKQRATPQRKLLTNAGEYHEREIPKSTIRKLEGNLGITSKNLEKKLVFKLECYNDLNWQTNVWEVKGMFLLTEANYSKKKCTIHGNSKETIGECIY